MGYVFIFLTFFIRNDSCQSQSASIFYNTIILCYIAGLIVYMNLGIKQSAVVVIATLICVFYGISKYYPIFTIDFILLYLTLYFVFFIYTSLDLQKL